MLLLFDLNKKYNSFDNYIALLSDDSDDETAMLMAELNKIKAEKQQEEEEKVANEIIKLENKVANR